MYRCKYQARGQCRIGRTTLTQLSEIKAVIAFHSEYDWIIVHSPAGDDDIVQIEGDSVWIRSDYRKALAKASSRPRGKMLTASELLAKAAKGGAK